MTDPAGPEHDTVVVMFSYVTDQIRHALNTRGPATVRAATNDPCDVVFEWPDGSTLTFQVA